MKRIKEFIVSENPPTSPNVGWLNIKDGNPKLQFNINGEFKEFTSSKDYIQLPSSVLETEPFTKTGQEGEDELNKIFAPYTFRGLCDKILKDKITTIELVSSVQNVLYNCSVLVENYKDGSYTYYLTLYIEGAIAVFFTSLDAHPSSTPSSGFKPFSYLVESSLKTINGQSIVGSGNITISNGTDGKDGKSIKSIELISNGTTITGGTATMDDDSVIPITVTTQSE